MSGRGAAGGDLWERVFERLECRAVAVGSAPACGTMARGATTWIASAGRTHASPLIFDTSCPFTYNPPLARPAQIPIDADVRRSPWLRPK